MLNRYEREIDALFFVLIITLIFVTIPKPISLDILGVTGKEFAIYPLALGMILMLYAWITSRRKRQIGGTINIDSKKDISKGSVTTNG